MAFRTKKISQMDPKGAPLASTDLLEISELVSGSYVTKSITGAEIITGATTGFVPTTRTLTTNAPLTGGGDLSVNRTLAISKATTAVDGYLSATDWTTFNAKQSALISGTNIKTINGSSVLGSGNLTVGGVIANYPLTQSGSTIGINLADEFTDGYLSSGDWSYFDSKQSALISGGNIKTINGSSILGGGNLVVGSSIAIGTTAITSGVVGRVLFEGTGNVVQESANLFWDNTNVRFGVGISTPLSPLHVVGSATSGFDAIRFKGQYSETGYLATSNGAIYLASGAGVTGSFLELSSSIANLRGGTTAVTFTVASERMRINNAGNVLINTTTDAGFKLDVNGTARLNNSVIAQTVSSVNVLDIGSIRIADDSNQRYIQGVNGMTVRSTNLASALSVSSNSTNSWDSSQLIRIRPQSGIGGVQFSTTSISAPSNSLMTFLRQRNDGGKSAIINTEDFAVSGSTPVNLFIYAGKETVLNNQANLILCHDGTTARGNTLIGTTTNIASAIVNVESTTQGFLPPRMTTTQKNAIATPATGLMVYDTTLNLISVYNGTIWISL